MYTIVYIGEGGVRFSVAANRMLNNRWLNTKHTIQNECIIMLVTLIR